MNTYLTIEHTGTPRRVNVALEPQPLVGWRSGLRPLWNREWRHWWRRRNVLVSALIWVILGYGCNLVLMLGSRVNAEVQAELATEVGLRTVNDMLLFGSLMMLLFTTVGAVVAGQDKLIGERQNGSMVDTLAKPVTRSAYLLSKYAVLPGMLLLMVLLPFALVVLTAAFFFGSMPNVAVIVTFPLLLMAAVTAFYTLTLLLGTLFEHRAPVLGIGLVAAFMLVQLLPPLMQLAAPPIVALMGTVVFLLVTGLCLAMAIWRFTSMELR